MDEIKPDKLMLYTMEGELFYEVNLLPGHYQDIVINKNNDIVLTKRGESEVDIYNSNFERTETISLNHDWQTFKIDMDGDGINEWINFSKDYML